jgi:hypothetical protein
MRRILDEVTLIRNMVMKIELKKKNQYRKRTDNMKNRMKTIWKRRRKRCE